MRVPAIIILLLSVISATAQRTYDVQHYRFDLELNDNNDSIYGKADISLKFTATTSLLIFDLAAIGSNGKGMQATLVTGQDVRGHARGGHDIKIPLNKAKNAGDTATYTIYYKGIPADGLIISKNKYGHRTFFADNWPNRGHNWLPCVDDPADKASVEFIVKAPVHYQVVANGIQIEETNLPNNRKLTHWKEDVPTSTKVMVIGVADFAVHLSGIVDNGIPVYSYVYPEDRSKGFYDYAQAAQILPWFIKNVGPYAYKKLANVQSKTTFGGLENANTIFYSENSVDGTRRSESLITHEIAHQWFGNMATEKTFAHLWLSEGFATYMTILYMESKYGKDTAIKMRAEDKQQVISFLRTSKKEVVDSTTTDYMSLLNANSYQKGGWVLHMLRMQLGDEVFWKSIRNYYAKYAGKTAGTEDLKNVFEETSKKDLERFFEQWLYTPYQPKVNIFWSYDDKKKEITVKCKQTETYRPFQFQLALDIIYTGKVPDSKTVHITEMESSFTFKVNGLPANIIADPDSNLLLETTVKRN